MGDIIGIGLQHFATRTAARKFELAAARGLAEEADDTKALLRHHMNMLEGTLEALVDLRVSRSEVAEALAILMDAVSNADHSCNRDIDAAGWHFDPIDLSDAKAMLDGLRP